jgi:hypothetical protein
LRTRICEGNRKAWCSEKSDAEKGRKEEVEKKKGLLWRVGQKAEKKGREGSGSTGVFNPENPAAAGWGASCSPWSAGPASRTVS